MKIWYNLIWLQGGAYYMITDFGKILKKYRIDANENLRDMACKLGITASYLSAIECGKRNIPENLIGKINDVYHLSDDKLNELYQAKDNSIKTISINVDGLNQYNRSIALQLSKCIDTIDIETSKMILSLLQQERPINA